MTDTETAAPAAGPAAISPRGSSTGSDSRATGLRLGLGARIFLLTSLLILLSVGAAVLFTTVLAGRIAREAVSEALTHSGSMEEHFQHQRYDELQLISSLFVADPYLTAYVAEAARNLDSRSILDLLLERRSDLGYDFAIVVDPEGRVLARTDRPGAAGEDLSGRPLVAAAVDDYQASGIWREGNRLYETVAVPLTQGPDLLGFLLTGFAVTDSAALEVRDATGTEIVFAVAGGDGRLAPVAATLETPVVETLLATLDGWGDRSGQEPFDISLAGEPWLARLRPLGDPDEPLGATIALASLNRQLAPYRQIVTVLAISGVLSVLVAFGLTYLLARRTLEPVRQLAAAAEAARRGDYSRPVPVGRKDEVGELARSLDALQRDLRERRDIEAYLAQLSLYLPEPHTPRPLPTRLPERREAVLLGVDLRGLAGFAARGGAGEVLERLAAALERFGAVVEARGGRVEAAAGHRLWAAFTGEERSLRALSAAAAAAAADRLGGNEPPPMALAAGTVTAGTLQPTLRPGAEDPGEADTRREALVGLPVEELETLLREASAGEILLSRQVHRELEAAFREAGYELAERAGVATARPFYALTPAVAARLTAGVAAAPPVSQSPSRSAGPSTGLPTGVGPGAVVGERFEILSLLGSGGMGAVFKARDRELDDVVALKMLRGDRWGDPEQIERLKDELKLARKITHPNVLRLYDLGTVDGAPYLSMEYVRGITLRTLLDRPEELPYSAGLRLGRQLCLGLAAVHDAGVIHRDIKPENVILGPAGNAKLMDFGIARPVERLVPGKTGAGFLVGTPRYLSPEQVRGEEIDRRADLFSLGVVLYEVFTGALPFPGGSPMEALVKTLEEEPVPPGNAKPGIDPRLEALLLRCLAKAPGDRFQTVGELRRELESLSA